MKLFPRQLAVRSKDFHAETLLELELLRSTILEQTTKTLWLREDQVEPAWPDCIWRQVKVLEIDSIADAQKKLKAISKTWRYYGDLFNRRGELIAQKLNTPKPTPLFHFPPTLAPSIIPAFTMATPNCILYSEHVQRISVDGQMAFKENKTTPPSRAYLKLWEALSILGEWPQKNEQVVDLGSSPGSWTWALAQLQTQVLSIDRSPLDAKVLAAKNITFKSGDAFQFKPVKMDWVFSDVICFPEKLLEYVQTWLESGLCEKFVCNVKFAGAVDPKIVDRFRRLPHSRVIHLLNGKKEVTWIRHPKLG